MKLIWGSFIEAEDMVIQSGFGSHRWGGFQITCSHLRWVWIISKKEEKPKKKGLIILTREEVESAMKKFEEEMKDDAVHKEERELLKLHKKEMK